MIYTWLFPTGRSAVQLLARHRGGYIDMGECLGLLTTCRQVYDEVSSLLRTERRFVVVQPKTIEIFWNNVWMSSWHVRRLISYLCDDGILELRYDLDKGTVVKKGPPFYDISEKLRRECMHFHHIQMDVMASVSYPFRGLEEWAWSVSDYLEETRSCCQYITLTLRLPKIDSNGNAAFYLPAARIFRATQDLHPHTQFKVVAADEDEDEAYTGPLVELTTIGQNLLVFVYDLLKLSSDPPNQPIPPIWVDRDLRVSHAEIECEDGQIMHVPYSRDCTLDEVNDKAYHLTEFFRGFPFSNNGVKDAVAPELAGYAADTVYAKDSLITLAEELAEVCVLA